MYNTGRHRVTHYWWFSKIKKTLKRKCTIHENIEWQITGDSVRIRKLWNVDVQYRKAYSDTLLMIQLKRRCAIQDDIEWHITDDSVRLRKPWNVDVQCRTI